MNNCNNCPPGQIPHTVRSGDTLWALATEHGTTVDEILKLNPGIQPENLQIGSVICLPFTGESYPMCRTGNYYVVRNVISLQSIASYFGVPADMMLKNNMGIDPNNLYRGQVLCIPIAPSPIEIHIGRGILKVRHKNGGETQCSVEGEFSGTACVINKQLDVGVNGARILNLSDGNAISGRSSGYGGLVVPDDDMDSLFNLTPVGTKVTG
ncbi:MAG: LysM peptidoglycan-binding domain-containing protein [Clostridia bacterium]